MIQINITRKLFSIFNREEKKEAIKALDPADMETEYEKYFPSE